MHRSLIPIVACLLLGAAGPACETPEEVPKAVEAAAAPVKPPELPGAASVVVARVDASLLEAADPNAEAIGTMLEGDLLTILGEQGEFSKVNVRATGTTGWLYSNLCLRIPLIPYWEGDTNKARETARRLYQDRFLVQRATDGRARFPVSKVKVETAFNAITFFADDGAAKPVLSRQDAEQLGRHALEQAQASFPEWKEPTIYVKGFDGKTDYTMTMGQDRVAHFL